MIAKTEAGFAMPTIVSSAAVELWKHQFIFFMVDIPEIRC